MKENFELILASRGDAGKGASRRLRRTGQVPGIVYGGGKDPAMVSVDHNELLKHLEHEAFFSHILSAKVDDGAEKVLLKDLQRHPARPFILHFDLLRVADTDRIRMNVPLHFVGEAVSPGVKAGGVLSHIRSSVEIACQVKDLPEFIAVDLSAMQIGDMLHLSELKLPEGVEIFALTQGADHDGAVASLHAPRGGTDEAEAGG